ncbi:MAG: hypothetical protein ACP5H8_00835 [Candidatus Micrarchaeia archaeon]
MRRLLLISALLMLISIVYSISQQDIENRSQEISRIVSNTSAAYVAVLLSIILAAMMYMGAQIFSSPKLSALSKDTLYQAIVSLVLIASLPVLYAVLSQIVIELFFGDIQVDGGMFEIAKVFVAWNEIYFFLHLLILTMLNTTITTLINQSYSIPLGGPLVSINLTGIAKPIMYVMGVSTSLITTALFINGFQLLLLNLVESSILQILLPLGVILRTFPSSTPAGNVLIAICIGSYIIVPAVYALDISILTKIADDEKGKGKLGLFGAFYNKNTLSAVIEGSECPYAKDLVHRFIDKDYSIFSSPLNDTYLEKCGISVGALDIAQKAWDKIPTWAKVVVGTAAGTKIMNSAINVISSFKSIASGTQGKLGKISFITAMLSEGATASLSLIFLIYIFDVIEDVGISFIILGVILPFLNFTIVVLFMRDFSYFALGTPLNLSHLVRLI